MMSLQPSSVAIRLTAPLLGLMALSAPSVCLRAMGSIAIVAGNA